MIDPASGTEGYRDILINTESGRIEQILPQGAGAQTQANSNGEFGNESVDVREEIDLCGQIVAPGLVDVHVHFRDPGFTYKEDIYTGAKAAVRGGFTSVVLMANTKPTVDTVETLHYVLGKGKETGIHVYSCANVTRGMKGQELTDMETLGANGAAGFTDDGIPLMDEKILRDTELQIDWTRKEIPPDT